MTDLSFHVGSEFVMHEESEHVYELPFLGSCSTTYYTFPMVARAFPDIFDLKIMPKLHLAEVVQCNSPQSIGWSVGINVLLESDQFLNVPNCGDIKVHIEKIVAVTHVFFDSVNRVEVSAKEIRSRIKIKSSPERKSSSSSSPSSPPAWRKAKLIPLKIGPTEVALQKSDLSISKEKDLIQLPQCNAVSSKDMHSAKGDFASSQPPYMWNSSAVSEGKPGPLEARTTCETRAKTQRPKVTLYYCQAYAKHICIIFSDNGTEILRANIDEILITSRPLLDLSQKLVTVMRQEVLFCASEIQIDNQLHVTGGYDFPVVFVSRAFLESSDCAQIDHPPMHFDLMQVRRNSLITLAAVLQRSSTSKSWYIQNVELGVKPFVIYLEDALLHAVSQMFRSCQMSSLCYWSKDVLSRDRVIPQQVLWSAINLGSPVTIQRFTILPISLMFSLHASLKLFISLDHTPLNFRSFEKEAFSTTWYRLGHALAMHYLSGALIRAGKILEL